MKDNILIIGASSEIAKEYIIQKNQSANIYSISRKKIRQKCTKKFIVKNFVNLQKNYFKKIFKNILFSKVLFFIGNQGPKKKKIINIHNKKILDTFLINSIVPIKLSQILIENKNITKKAIFIFFSSRSGSIAERGSMKHHKKKGNHIYRASKSLLNSFVKNLSFEQNHKNYIFVCYHPGWVDTKSAKGKMTKNKAIKYFNKFENNLQKKNSGNFYNFDGEKIPW